LLINKTPLLDLVPPYVITFANFGDDRWTSFVVARSNFAIPHWLCTSSLQHQCRN